MSDELTRADYLEAYAEGRDLLAATASLVGADAPVPSCPGWSVADLLIHAGNVHRWASAVLETGEEQPQVFDAVPAAERAELVGWYVECGHDLHDLLAGLGSDGETGMETWTFGPVSGADFWFRRQAHEVTMHAADARLAAEVGIVDIVAGLRPELAADGVDEVVKVFLPRVALFAPRPSLPGRLALVATDTGDRWELEPDGRIDSAATGSAVEATLAGPAGALWALLWRRAAFGRDGDALGVQVEGDRAVVEALFTALLTP